MSKELGKLHVHWLASLFPLDIAEDMLVNVRARGRQRQQTLLSARSGLGRRVRDENIVRGLLRGSWDAAAPLTHRPGQPTFTRDPVRANTMRHLLRQVLCIITAFAVASCAGSRLGRKIGRAMEPKPHKVCETTEPQFNTAPYRTVAVVGNCPEFVSGVESVLVDNGHYQVVDLERAFGSGDVSGVDAQVIIECTGQGARMRFVDSKTGRVVATESVPKGYSYAGLGDTGLLAGAIVPLRHCWMER
jgi:hypothetical protein